MYKWWKVFTEQLVSNRHVDDGSSPLNDVTFLDLLVITEHDNTDIVGLQVEGHALQIRTELHHLLGLWEKIQSFKMYENEVLISND